jgi:hypothetical protein
MAAKDTDERKQDDQDSDGAMLDMSQAAVKRMIGDAKERGYITYDQLNQVLPPEQVSSEQIEDVMSMLSEMGINVIENDEAEGGRGQGRRPRRGVDLARGRGRGLHLRDARPHRRPGADVPARDGLGRAAVARGRDRHRQADRGRPQHDDRGALRKPADLPGHHHLARRASVRGHPAARRHRPRDHLRPLDGRG